MSPAGSPSPSSGPSSRATGPRQVLLVVLLALLPYVLLPPKPFLLDAKQAIRGNELLTEGALGPLLTHDFWGRPMDVRYATRSYRPLVALTWAAQHRVVGLSPAALHLVDMTLHAGVAVLVLLLLTALLPRPGWALPAAGLWAVHPVLSESVVSMVGRADMLASGLLFGALLAQTGSVRGTRPVTLGLAGGALVTAAMFCKEYAVVFPFVLVAVHLALTRAEGSRTPVAKAVPGWAVAFAGLFGYLAVRYALAGEIGGVPMIGVADQPLVGASLSVRWGTAASLTLLAMRLLVAPFGLSYFYYGQGALPIASGLFDGRSIVAMLVLAGLGAICLYRVARRGDALPAIAYVLFLFPLGPSLNTVSLAGVLFAERYLYVPAAGLALMAGWAASRYAVSRASRRVAVAVFVVLILAGGLVTAKRVEDWSSLESLVRSSIDTYPDSAILWQELAFARGLEGDHVEAARLFEESIERYDGSPKVWRNYGVSLLHLERFSDAAAAFRRALQLSPPDLGLLWRSLGNAELAAGRFDEAASALRRARDLLPADYPTAQALAQALLRGAQEKLRDGDPAAAASLAREAVEIGDLPPGALFLAGQVLHRAGAPAVAREILDRALAADPSILRRRFEKAQEAVQGGRPEVAIDLYGEILTARPDHVPSLFNLGRALLEAGRPAEAVEPLERGLALADDPRARQLLATARGGAR